VEKRGIQKPLEHYQAGEATGQGLLEPRQLSARQIESLPAGPTPSAP